VSAFRTIRARFTGWYLVILAILLVLLSIGLYFTISLTLRRDIDNSLWHRSEQLAGTRGLLQSAREGRFEEALGELVAFYTLAEDGFEVTATREIESLIEPEWLDAALQGAPSFETVTTEDERLVRLHIALLRAPAELPAPPADRGRENPARPPVPGGESPLGDAPPEGPTVLVVGRPMDILSSALAALRTTLLIAIPLTLLVSAGGGLFLLRRALRPVDRMIETARVIEETDLTSRIEVTTEDELGRLGATLNAMLERLQDAFQRQRQFTDDASHELRSPLSVIEAEASLALRRERSAEDYRDALSIVSDEAGKMNKLINQLLTLARGDAGEEAVPFEPLDLAEVARETVGAMAPLAEEKGVHLRFDASESYGLRGSRPDLIRLLTNLIDNAIRHTPADGSVNVSVRRAGESIETIVADTGAGIAAEHLPHVFKRFYRADKARSRESGGSGLGLAICKQIVDAHGGTIEVESVPDEGTRFTVRLPTA